MHGLLATNCFHNHYVSYYHFVNNTSKVGVGDWFSSCFVHISNFHVLRAIINKNRDIITKSSNRFHSLEAVNIFYSFMGEHYGVVVFDFLAAVNNRLSNLLFTSFSLIVEY
jgi:hypothetical protein